MGNHDPKLMRLPIVLFLSGNGDRQACPGCVYEMGLLDLPERSPTSAPIPTFNALYAPEGVVLALEDGFDPTMVEAVHNLAWRRVAGKVEGTIALYKRWVQVALEQLVDMGLLRRNAADPRVWETVEDGVVTSHGTLVFTE